VKPLQRNARRQHLHQLAEEIHHAATCLNASRAAICLKTGVSADRWRVLAVLDRSTRYAPFAIASHELATTLET
jgi:hypothetical protein